MSDQTSPASHSVSQTQANLRTIAASLREAGHLEPETQNKLASLLEELGTEIGTSGSVSPNTTHLAAAVSEMARSLHEQHPKGVVETARNRLKDAAVRAEIDAPVASGVVYRIIDLLASMGI